MHPNAFYTSRCSNHYDELLGLWDKQVKVVSLRDEHGGAIKIQVCFPECQVCKPEIGDLHKCHKHDFSRASWMHPCRMYFDESASHQLLAII